MGATQNYRATVPADHSGVARDGGARTALHTPGAAPSPWRNGPVTAVGWEVADDRVQYSAAEQLHERHHRLWWVMWGPGARRYFAFYQGDADLAPLSDASAEGLEIQIRRAQTVIARTHPASYWRCPVSCCSWTSINPVSHAPCPLPVPSYR